MLPADQCFGADDLADLRDLRLIMQQELPVLLGEDDVSFECGSHHDDFLHGRIEETEGIAAIALGVVQGQIHLHQQRFDGDVLFAEYRPTNACRAAICAVAQVIRFPQFAQNLGADHFSMCGGMFQGVTEVFENDRKFITTDPGDRVVLAHGIE